jgi:hypothetical protein
LFFQGNVVARLFFLVTVKREQTKKNKKEKKEK